MDRLEQHRMYNSLPRHKHQVNGVILKCCHGNTNIMIGCLKNYYSAFPKACFTVIVRPFVRAILPRPKERRDREAECRYFHTESQNVRQPYNYFTSHTRLL